MRLVTLIILAITSTSCCTHDVVTVALPLPHDPVLPSIHEDRLECLDQETYEGLSEQIYEFLIAAYPNKTVEQFMIQKRAATVVFTGTGLSVDVVPVIAKKGRPDYGWQFGLDGSKTLTCAPGQIKFIKTRKDVDADFRTLVRLGKKWRNRHIDDLKPLKSFMIELIFNVPIK